MTPVQVQAIRDPHDSMSTLTWSKRGRANKVACLNILRGVMRRREKAKREGVPRRYYVQFNLRQGSVDHTGWPRGTWPLLFPTREDAELFMELMPIFFGNAPYRFGGPKGNIRSATVTRSRFA